MHETVLKTPVRLGTTYDEKTITTMNRVTGQIDTNTMTIEKPVIGVVNVPRQISTEHKTLVDVHTGKVIELNKRPLYHGIDSS